MFATLFRDTATEDAEDYHNLMTTMRALIDCFLANFQNKEMANYNTSHSVLVIAHVVISNVFLLNFLIAILSSVYEIMIRNGDFYAIEYQYKFITKYMKALEEDNGYDKFIVYPPPMNFFLIPLIFVIPSRKWTKKISKFIAYTVFWFENIFVIMAFFFYLVVHNPLIMFKIHFQIMTKIEGFFNKLFYFVVWTFGGMFYLVFVNLVDTCMLINILCVDNSLVYDQSEDERSKSL